MTMCNMSIEAGARAGMVAPDETTFDYLKGRPHAPTGADWDAAVAAWRSLRSDRRCDVRQGGRTSTPPTLTPFVTWGTNPGQGAPLGAAVPDPADRSATSRRSAPRPRRWSTWVWSPGTPLREIAVDTVFVGSCTNGRIEDLRAVAEVLRGRTGRRRRADARRARARRGVRAHAEAEGLDEVFTAAGAEWRLPGCSMCLGMNPDQLAPGERSASTSNRNFEGRQGKGGRTHLVSPQVAAATAVRVTSVAGRPRARLTFPGVRRGSSRACPAVRRRPARPNSDGPAQPHQRPTAVKGATVETFTDPHRGRRTAAPQQRRHRPDHPGELPQAGDPHRIRGRPVRRLARRSRLRPERGTVRRRVGARRRARLRHRQLSREHAVWALMDYGFRVVISLAVRRHLPRELRQGRPAHRPGQPRTTSSCCSSCWRRSPAPRSPSTWRPRPSPAAASWSRSRWTTTSAGACSQGLDDIALTLRHTEAIAAYEAARPSHLPVTTPA